MSPKVIVLQDERFNFGSEQVQVVFFWWNHSQAFLFRSQDVFETAPVLKSFLKSFFLPAGGGSVGPLKKTCFISIYQPILIIFDN